MKVTLTPVNMAEPLVGTKRTGVESRHASKALVDHLLFEPGFIQRRLRRAWGRAHRRAKCANARRFAPRAHFFTGPGLHPGGCDRPAGRLDTNAKTYVGPAPGANLTARDILIIATGQNGQSGNIHTSPKAAQFGERNTVIANVYAPNGTLWLKANTQATGAFIARWVMVGERVTLTLANGF